MADTSIFSALAAYLTNIGLEGLFTVGPDGTPSGWLWDQITDGIDSEQALAVQIEATPQFQQRYGVITEMRRRSAAGESVRVPTIRDVREYEDTAAKVMRVAGLPSWFYDSYQDTQALMLKGVSVPELEQRIGTGWSRVRDAPPEVRQMFSEFYGVAQGDAALAAFILDPTVTQSKLEQASRAAYTSGYGRTMGIDIDQQRAEAIAMLPKTEGGIQQDLSQISALNPVFNEGITETDDLTTNTGIDAVALGDGAASNAIGRRIAERQANERSSTGGALSTQAGVLGLSST